MLSGKRLSCLLRKYSDISASSKKLVLSPDASEAGLTELCEIATEQAWKKCMHDYKSEFGWQVIYDKYETLIQKKELTHEAGEVRKRQGMIMAPPINVIKFIKDPLNWKKWNEVCLDCHYLKKLGNFSILYYKLSLSWPVSPREFVLAETVKELDDGYAYILKSIDLEIEPQDKDTVRGFMNYAGFIAKHPLQKPDRTELTYITSIDMKGKIPNPVIKEAHARRHNALHNVRKYLEEK